MVSNYDVFAITSFVFDILVISKNPNIVLRSNNLANYIKTILLYLCFALLLGVVVCILMNLRDFSGGTFGLYSIDASTYFVFLFIRIVIIFSLLGIILYFIGWNYKRGYMILFCFLIIGLLFFTIDIVQLDNINSILKIPLLATSYLKTAIFSNFPLEISASIIQVILLSVFAIILFNIYYKSNQKEKIK